MNVKKMIEEIYPEILEIRRDFHQYPELSEKETRTQGKICDYLKQWGIPYATIADTGVVANLTGTGKDGKTVAIRADIDALPIEEINDVPYKSKNLGIMHACGHDIHTAILLGTAKVLKSMEKDLLGNAKFLFQPAEETIGGAKRLIEEGCLENPPVSAVIGLHVSPQIPVGCVELKRGPQSAASNEFTVVVKGKPSHGASPEKGVDALLVACQMVSDLQSIVSRNIGATNSVVVTVGQLNAGTKNNIIAGEATFHGIIRTLNGDTMDFVKKRLKEFVENMAKAHGTVAEVSFVESYPAVINDDGVQDVLEKVARENFTKEQIRFMEFPTMGAEDFSYFCESSKGGFFNIGTGKIDQSDPEPIHSNAFDPDEESIKVGILMEVQAVLELLK